MTAPAPIRGTALPALAMTRRKKAAIVLAALGPEAAGPLLDQFDEGALRNFAQAMSSLGRIEPETVQAVIRDFMAELDRAGSIVTGGLREAREMLEPHVPEQTLLRIMDDVDMPSVHNVWKKLARVQDQALADFLAREHPQTAAVVLSKLASDHAARILSKFEPDRARDIVVGITKAQSLDVAVVEAIGTSVSRDFLSVHQTEGQRNPAERVGAIMNYTALEIRNHVLGYIGEHHPEFAEEVKRKMFTFEDIPHRIEPRDCAAVVRAVDQETLLKALVGAEEVAPETRDFLLKNISSRVAEQLREAMSETGKVRKRDAELAQNEVIRAIRDLVAKGEMKMIAEDDEA